jgi:hypothetical protein
VLRSDVAAAACRVTDGFAASRNFHSQQLLRGRVSLLTKPTVFSVGKDALNCFCSHTAARKINSCLVNEFWGLNSDRILQPLLRFVGGFGRFRAPDATQRLPPRFHHAADLPAQRRRARD